MIADIVRRSFAFRHRAKWLAFLGIGLPVAGIVMALIVPACAAMMR